MVFKPYPCGPLKQAITVAVGVLLFDLLLIGLFFSRAVDILSFVLALLVLLSFPPLLYLSNRIYGALTLEYWLDRDALTIIWGSSQHILPLPQIRQIVRHAEALDEVSKTLSPPPFSVQSKFWRRWPALWVGEDTLHNLGTVQAFSSVPAHEQLLIVTDQGPYGISPAQPERFLNALQERHRLGSGRFKTVEAIQPAWWTLPAWHDRIAFAVLGLAFVLNLALFGYLALRYPGLPDNIPLHFDALGKADRIGERTAVFILPLIGLLVLGVNTLSGLGLYLRQRLGAYLLWGGAVLVQILIWLAARNLVVR